MNGLLFVRFFYFGRAGQSKLHEKVSFMRSFYTQLFLYTVV